MDFTIICTNKGLSLDEATELGKVFQTAMDDNMPAEVKAGAFFHLVDIKQEMLNEECYEILADFLKIEELYKLSIPVKTPI